MQTIDRDETLAMIEDEEKDTAVIEVLGPEYFDKFHLPGAQNIPLDENFDTKIQQAVPDKSQPVIVYCLNQDCEASPKAAKRMEELGYQNVYDYEAGKMDWKEAGFHVES